MILVHKTRWDLSIKNTASRGSPLSVLNFKIDKELQIGRYKNDTWVMISIILRVTASTKWYPVCCRCQTEIDKARVRPKVHLLIMVIYIIPLKPAITELRTCLSSFPITWQI